MFIALEVAIEAVRSLAPVAERIANRNPNLADQLRRAAESVAANLGEGRRRIGRDRTHHYRIAAGSADEAIVILRTAEAWGYLAASDYAAAYSHLDRVLALTWPLVRH
jgi:four helix bundle protein